MDRYESLDERALADLAARAPEWELRDGAFHRSFKFANFSEAFAFMARVALIAETLDHHPDWRNVWNRVEIAISTHDIDGLSTQDAEFIAAVDALVG